MKVVFLRHGESLWNKLSLFTGWYDVPLTQRGIQEAGAAARRLKESGYSFDIAFSNLHKRTLKTLGIVLKELKLTKIPVHKAWQLNERHYGALTGLNKAATAKKYGDQQVHIWRRSYSIRPPSMKRTDSKYRAIVKMYKDVPKKCIPLAESLKDTYNRTVPYWKNVIAPEVRKGRKVLIAASHNSLRSIIKYLDNIPESEIQNYTIPYGIPLVYELDSKLKPVRHYYLGKASEIKKVLAEMAAQGKAK
ncbi:MAG: 2,3-diphosphoglycerate-dependent phosphoglycerate mutase [Candidatus Woesearchaeota archaeon]